MIAVDHEPPGGSERRRLYLLAVLLYSCIDGDHFRTIYMTSPWSASSTRPSAFSSRCSSRPRSGESDRRSVAPSLKCPLCSILLLLSWLLAGSDYSIEVINSICSESLISNICRPQLARFVVTAIGWRGGTEVTMKL